MSNKKVNQLPLATSLGAKVFPIAHPDTGVLEKVPLSLLKSALDALGGPSIIILPAGTPSYNATAGSFIRMFLITDNTDIDVNIGITEGGAEVSEFLEVRNGYGIHGSPVYRSAATTYYFTGITSNTVIKIDKA